MLLTKRQLNELQRRIGIIFHNAALLEQAFIHRSYLNEHRGQNLQHNECLEFLGDAVLELSITKFLLKKLTDAPEGKLTAVRSALVNYLVLSEVAESLELDKFLFLSNGEQKQLDARNRSRTVIMANTFEALLGAIFSDRGLGLVDLFLMNTLFPRLEDVIKHQRYIDPKSCIQELSQQHDSVTPSYRVLDEYGPDHDKHFVVGVYFGERYVGEGIGQSKLEAEIDAARSALRKEFRVTLA